MAKFNLPISDKMAYLLCQWVIYAKLTLAIIKRATLAKTSQHQNTFK